MTHRDRLHRGQQIENIGTGPDAKRNFGGYGVTQDLGRRDCELFAAYYVALHGKLIWVYTMADPIKNRSLFRWISYVLGAFVALEAIEESRKNRDDAPPVAMVSN